MSMNDSDIRRGVLAALLSVAPEADEASLRSDAPLRDQLDIDSLDYLNFLTRIDERFHVAVPESDYSKVTTLDDLVRYIAAR